jgi:hypothetical protein
MNDEKNYIQQMSNFAIDGGLWGRYYIGYQNIYNVHFMYGIKVRSNNDESER